MAFCQNCGAAVDGKFCAKCGAPSGVEPGSPGPPPANGLGNPGLTDNLASALAYIPVVGIVFLLIEPFNRNKTIRFHAFQGLFLLLASIVVSIVLSTLTAMLWSIVFLMPLVHLAFFALWIFLMFKAYSGVKIVLPVIGPIAEKQA